MVSSHDKSIMGCSNMDDLINLGDNLCIDGNIIWAGMDSSN